MSWWEWLIVIIIIILFIWLIIWLINRGDDNGLRCKTDSDCDSGNCSKSFCQPEGIDTGETGAYCSPDAEPRCTNGGTCVDNKCTSGPKTKNGNPCTLDADCESNICINKLCGRPDESDCTTNTQCANNLCLNNKCQPKLEDGSSCTNSSQCVSNNCQLNLCQPTSYQPGGQGTYCTPGTTQCLEGLKCITNNSGKSQCLTGGYRTNGQTCNLAESQCGPGSYCSGVPNFPEYGTYCQPLGTSTGLEGAVCQPVSGNPDTGRPPCLDIRTEDGRDIQLVCSIPTEGKFGVCKPTAVAGEAGDPCLNESDCISGKCNYTVSNPTTATQKYCGIAIGGSCADDPFVCASQNCLGGLCQTIKQGALPFYSNCIASATEICDIYNTCRIVNPELSSSQKKCLFLNDNPNACSNPSNTVTGCTPDYVCQAIPNSISICKGAALVPATSGQVCNSGAAPNINSISVYNLGEKKWTSWNPIGPIKGILINGAEYVNLAFTKMVAKVDKTGQVVLWGLDLNRGLFYTTEPIPGTDAIWTLAPKAGERGQDPPALAAVAQFTSKFTALNPYTCGGTTQTLVSHTYNLSIRDFSVTEDNVAWVVYQAVQACDTAGQPSLDNRGRFCVYYSINLGVSMTKFPDYWSSKNGVIGITGTGRNGLYNIYSFDVIGDIGVKGVKIPYMYAVGTTGANAPINAYVLHFISGKYLEFQPLTLSPFSAIDTKTIIRAVKTPKGFTQISSYMFNYPFKNSNTLANLTNAIAMPYRIPYHATNTTNVVYSYDTLNNHWASVSNSLMIPPNGYNLPVYYDMFNIYTQINPGLSTNRGIRYTGAPGTTIINTTFLLAKSNNTTSSNIYLYMIPNLLTNDIVNGVGNAISPADGTILPGYFDENTRIAGATYRDSLTTYRTNIYVYSTSRCSK